MEAFLVKYSTSFLSSVGKDMIRECVGRKKPQKEQEQEEEIIK